MYHFGDAPFVVRRDKAQGLEMYCAVSGLEVCTCISHAKGPVACGAATVALGGGEGV